MLYSGDPPKRLKLIHFSGIGGPGAEESTHQKPLFSECVVSIAPIRRIRRVSLAGALYSL